MSIYSELHAKSVAKELIQAGLQSGAIRLHGCTAIGDAQASSDADALYLSNLLIKLTEQISTSDA
jgi:hypothetical protein